jgi:hypothetical protein
MAALAGYLAQLYITSTPSLALTNEVLTDAGDHKTFNEPTAAKVEWDKDTAFVVQAEADEVQTITITGAPTGGTFTLSFGGNTTSALNWNATAAQVQTALQALPSIGAANALVTGGPGPGTPFTVEFTSAKGFASQALITKTASLTGGTSPDVVITEAQAGFTWTTQSSGFVINYPIGQVVFTTAFLGTSAGCRISSGAYYPFSFLGNAKSVEVNPTLSLLDSTVITNPPSPWMTRVASLAGASVKLGKLWVDNSLAGGVTNATRLILIAYSGANANQRYVGYVRTKQDHLKFAVNALVTEDVDFDVDGQLYYIAS